MDPKHLLHQLMVGPTTKRDCNLDTHLCLQHARLLNELSKSNNQGAQWIDDKWDVKYCEGQSELHLFVPKPSVRPLGMGLPRSA